MRSMRVTNTRRGVLLGTRVKLADRWWPRLRGFLGRPAPEQGEGLLLTPCQAVHTYGMRFSLDVVFLDREGVVVGLYEHLGPSSRTKMETKALHALELPAGTIAATGTMEGDRVAWMPASSEPTNGAPPSEAPEPGWLGRFGRGTSSNGGPSAGTGQREAESLDGGERGFEHGDGGGAETSDGPRYPENRSRGRRDSGPRWRSK